MTLSLLICSKRIIHQMFGSAHDNHPNNQPAKICGGTL